jgi:hypothetical protein
MAQALDALRDEIKTYRRCLRAALLEYEATGDHNHNGRPLKSGAACEGGDCTVDRVRRALAALEEV